MILSLIFWVIAAITYAGISVLLFRPTTNIFTTFKDQRFWSMAGSNNNPIYLPHSKYKVDSYHFAQTIMIICFAISAMFHFHHALTSLWWGWNAAIELVAYCVFWIVPFNLFFNHLFIKKQSQ